MEKRSTIPRGFEGKTRGRKPKLFGGLTMSAHERTILLRDLGAWDVSFMRPPAACSPATWFEERDLEKGVARMAELDAIAAEHGGWAAWNKLGAGWPKGRRRNPETAIRPPGSAKRERLDEHAEKMRARNMATRRVAA